MRVKIKKIFWMAMFCLLSYFAITKYDEIKTALKKDGNVQSYIINIDPRIDGSLNMKYRIELLLDKDIEKITLSIPNKNYSVLDKSSNIKEIHDNLLFNKVDISLDRKYVTGEKIILNFTMIQNNVYELTRKNEICMFKINAGKIVNFKMQEATIYWNKSNVYFSGLAKENEKCYTYTQNLRSLYKSPLVMQYYSGSFDLNKETKKKFSVMDLFNNSYIYFLILALIIITEIKTNSNLLKNDIYLYK